MDGWGRVVAAVVDRRAELGWTQKGLAAQAKVSERTVQNLEAGARPQARNRHKIEQALGWPSGEMRRIEEGRDRSPPRSVIDEVFGDKADDLREGMRRAYGPDADRKLRLVEEALSRPAGDDGAQSEPRARPARR